LNDFRMQTNSDMLHPHQIWRTCVHCRCQDVANRWAQREEAQGAMAAAQIAENLPQRVDPNGPDDEGGAAQNGGAGADPNLAVSAEDRTLLQAFCDQLMNISLEHCSKCNEEWFDLKVSVQHDGRALCARCVRSDKFSEINQMCPGPDPQSLFLPELTQMEEILISPVHTHLQVWKVKGGQSKYRGHICNFFRNVGRFHNWIPLLPEEEVNIIILWCHNDNNNDSQFEDFHVCRDVIRKWLHFLQVNHPSFHSTQVHIDWNRLQQLPENGLVHNAVHNITEENPNDTGFDEEGPPENGGSGIEDMADANVFSCGFVPNLARESTELEELRRCWGYSVLYYSHKFPQILTSS
jgi:hypothetical protein